MKVLEYAFIFLAAGLFFWAAVACEQGTTRQGHFIVAALMTATAALFTHGLRR